MFRHRPRTVMIATLGVFALVGPGWPYVMAALGVGPGRHDDLGDLLLRSLIRFWVPAVALATVLFGPSRVPAALGLAASPLLAAAVGVLCTLPMFVGYAIQGTFTSSPALLDSALRSALLPGLNEELLFRGMLFGFLFRFANWGFLPAAAIGAVLFGAGHLWQGHTPAETAGVFAITALGAVWFAWLYVEWRMNLWVPIACHVLMNLAWDLFAIGESALGDGPANLWRFATVGVSIALTVAWARRHGGLAIRGRRWWRCEQSAP